jgi:hypothetical protein
MRGRVRAVAMPVAFRAMFMLVFMRLAGKVVVSEFGTRLALDDLSVFHGGDQVVLRPSKVLADGLLIVGDGGNFHSFYSLLSLPDLLGQFFDGGLQRVEPRFERGCALLEVDSAAAASEAATATEAASASRSALTVAVALSASCAWTLSLRSSSVLEWHVVLLSYALSVTFS